jgi:hypothetical protein
MATQWEYAQLAFSADGSKIAEGFHLLYSHDPVYAEEPGKRSVVEAIRDLGDQAWEMVSTTMVEDGVIMWFKRPIEGVR